jgi:MFS family permease
MTLRVLGGGLNANFWKLWGSSATANLADGITAIAIPLIALTLTRSPAEIAAVTVAAQVPMLLLGLIAGGLADRLDRRWTMFLVQLLRVAVVGTLTVLALADALSMPIIYAAAFTIGTGEAFFDTNAQSILPAIVGKDRLVIANGRLFAAETVMNQFVGPPVGGLLIALSVPLALGAGAVGYALGAVGLLMIVGSFRAERAGPPRRLHVEIGEGIGYLGRDPLLLTLSSMVALGRLGSTGFFALLALYAVAPGPMGLSEPGFGLLLVTIGLGSLVGSALTPEPLIVGIGFFIGGIAIMTWNVTNVSLRQSILPSHLMGRVHATHRFMANGAGLIGAVLAGIVGEALGLPAVFAIGAGIVLLGLFGRLVVTEERIRAAEAQAATS